MRQSVYQIFMALFALMIFAVFVFIATIFIRGGLTMGYRFLVSGVPHIVQTIWADPWYIVALILGVLLVWSWPWEGEGATPDPVRRGRVVTNFPRTTPRAVPTRRSTPAGGAPSRRSQPAGSRIRRPQ
jgi:hypothetical protein